MQASTTLALMGSQLRVAARERIVIFFNYLFPLIFFFIFGEVMDARRSLGSAQSVVAMVLSIGAIGNGLFGMGISMVAERERGILRRLHLAPITPIPVLSSALLAGLLVFLPSLVLTLTLARFVYFVPVPENVISLVLFLSIASLAFRAIGLIIAAVANSMNEAQILIQLLYFPMLFLSGVTFPVSLFPEWLQTISRFIPSTYLMSGMQGILRNGETLSSNLHSVIALAITILVGFFVSYQLFRWDTEDKIPARARVWVLGALAPFVALGVWENYRGTEAVRQSVTMRQMARSRNWVVRDVRVFVGDGTVVQRADIYVRNGRIVSVVADGESAPENANLFAVVDSAGKTLLPGFIDVHAHLGSPGAVSSDMAQYVADWPERALKSYLYCGVTAVWSLQDVTEQVLRLKERIRRAEVLGAELFVAGPAFTAPGGRGTEYVKYFPPVIRDRLEREMVAAYTSPAEATVRVDELAAQGVDGLKAILDSGDPGRPRLDLAVFDEITKAAARHRLPIVVHTGNVRDISDAVGRAISGIEHGATRDAIPAQVIASVRSMGVRYDPTLVVLDALFHLGRKDVSLLEEPLTRQTAPDPLLNGFQEWIQQNDIFGDSPFPDVLETPAVENLKKLYAAGVPLVLGTDAGNLGVFHGPALHREMEIWSAAGIPPSEILKAATFNGAQLLNASDRIGRIAAGYEASFVIVDGNPLEDISATRRISDVFFKGERVERSALFR